MILKKLLSICLGICCILVSFDTVYATGKVFSINPDPVTSAMGDAGVALPSTSVNGAVINPSATIGIYRTVVSLSATNFLFVSSINITPNSPYILLICKSSNFL